MEERKGKERKRREGEWSSGHLFSSPVYRHEIDEEFRGIRLRGTVVTETHEVRESAVACSDVDGASLGIEKHDIIEGGPYGASWLSIPRVWLSFELGLGLAEIETERGLDSGKRNRGCSKVRSRHITRPDAPCR